MRSEVPLFLLALAALLFFFVFLLSETMQEVFLAGLDVAGATFVYAAVPLLAVAAFWGGARFYRRILRL